jgi:cell division protein FtsQ
MSGSPEEFQQARNWREIPQEVKPRAMSRTGRRRYVMSLSKVIGGTMLVAVLGWGLFELFSTLENNPRELAQATQAEPVREVVPLSDGVLCGAQGSAWLGQVLGIPKTATLMELDLPRLQAKILASGQVKSAVLVKQFPSKLIVNLSERAPVARIMVEDSQGQQSQLLVARDGVVFAGVGYDVAFTDTLPWLSGVKLSRNGASIQPIEGMEVVADLLAKAKYEAEQLYPLFQIVNLSRLKSDGAIEVSSPECDCVVFSTNEDFFQQLALLDSIRDTVRPTREMPLAKVDLTLGRDVAVSYRPVLAKQPLDANGKGGKPAAPAKAAATQQPAAKEASPLLFNFQRNTPNREL